MIAAAVTACLLCVGVITGTLAHEAGHLFAAQALRLHPRQLTLGSGQVGAVIPIGKLRVCLRRVPLGGSVIVLPSRQRRRAAEAVFILGGGVANLALFALLITAAAADQPLARWLGPVAFVQAVLAFNLLPFRVTRDGQHIGSDGLYLIKTLFGRKNSALADAFADLVRPLLPPGTPLPPVSAASAEICYQVYRPERGGEDWARKDASAAMRDILARGGLTLAERAVVLDFLVGSELLIGDTGASNDELDAWSLEALSLFEAASLQVTRGAALAVLGRPAEAQAMLTAALGQTLAPLDAAIGRLALSHVDRALGCTGTAPGPEPSAPGSLPAKDALPAGVDGVTLKTTARLKQLLDRNAVCPKQSQAQPVMP